MSTPVALLNYCYWPEVRRGTERVIHDLAGELHGGAYQPEIITSHPARTSVVREQGVRVVRNWRPPDAPLRLRKLGDHLTHLPLSYRSLHTGDYALAHAFYQSDALAAVAWSRRTGRPAVFSWMGLMVRGWLSSRRLRLETVQRAVYGSDAVVALSRAAQESIWRWMGVEARIIHPGVDTTLFVPGDARDEPPTIVCAAAADEPVKRVALLAAAFARVRRERADARLILMRPRDRSLEAALAGPGVEFSDATSDQLVELYQRASVSVLPSFNEAFGLVLTEALACGTPVVATRDGGMAEIVDRPEIGRLFDGDDEDALARAVLDALALAADPATRTHCRERAEDFSSAAAGRLHAELYAELLSGG
ncbi:MAG: glycosyltransferase family 4 protein [Thermoleophilaceae bacterium]